jgi:hypothetical protein
MSIHDFQTIMLPLLELLGDGHLRLEADRLGLLHRRGSVSR